MELWLVFSDFKTDWSMIFSFMLSAPRYVLSILLLKVDWATSPRSLNLKPSRVIYAFPVFT